jgi:hypothetical protein
MKFLLDIYHFFFPIKTLIDLKDYEYKIVEFESNGGHKKYTTFKRTPNTEWVRVQNHCDYGTYEVALEFLTEEIERIRDCAEKTSWKTVAETQYEIVALKLIPTIKSNS